MVTSGTEWHHCERCTQWPWHAFSRRSKLLSCSCSFTATCTPSSCSCFVCYRLTLTYLFTSIKFEVTVRQKGDVEKQVNCSADIVVRCPRNFQGCQTVSTANKAILLLFQPERPKFVTPSGRSHTNCRIISYTVKSVFWFSNRLSQTILLYFPLKLPHFDLSK